jgi:hypothetical protein
MTGELKDIELCMLGVVRAGERIDPFYRKGFLMMNLIRRWVFLLALGYTIPVLVVFRGGDALSGAHRRHSSLQPPRAVATVSQLLVVVHALITSCNLVRASQCAHCAVCFNTVAIVRVNAATLNTARTPPLSIAASCFVADNDNTLMLRCRCRCRRRLCRRCCCLALHV